MCSDWSGNITSLQLDSKRIQCAEGKKAVRRTKSLADVNVVLVDVGKLISNQDDDCSTDKPVLCDSCGAILSVVSQVNGKTWICKMNLQFILKILR